MKKLSRQHFIKGTLAAGVGATFGIGLLANAGCSDSGATPPDGGKSETSVRDQAVTDTPAADQTATTDKGPTSDNGITPDITPDQASGSCGTTITNLILSSIGHSLEVPRADVAAGAQKEYDLQGTSTHPHFITVTAADFTALRNGQSVTKTSFDKQQTGHTHDVTIRCS